MKEFEFAILNIDKPSGPTSFNISDYVRKTLGLRKTSHFGTLDPKVTGVLPIALNRACKLTGFFIGHDKEYVGIMRIHEDIELEKIEEMIKKKFLGIIKQTPPVKSRVKRQEREREIKNFELLEKDGKDILFRVVCQGGTYIRKLCDDLGRELGIGAHMLELRRTRAGIFEEAPQGCPPKIKDFTRGKADNSITLYEFEKAIKDGDLDKYLISGEDALKKIFPIVQVKEESVERLLTGKPIIKSDVVKGDITKRFIVFFEDKFIGVYEDSKPLFVYQEVKN